MTTKQTLIPSISQIRNQIFRGRKPPRVRVPKRVKLLNMLAGSLRGTKPPNMLIGGEVTLLRVKGDGVSK